MITQGFVYLLGTIMVITGLLALFVDVKEPK